MWAFPTTQHSCARVPCERGCFGRQSAGLDLGPDHCVTQRGGPRAGRPVAQCSRATLAPPSYCRCQQRWAGVRLSTDRRERARCAEGLDLVCLRPLACHSSRLHCLRVWRALPGTSIFFEKSRGTTLSCFSADRNQQCRRLTLRLETTPVSPPQPWRAALLLRRRLPCPSLLL